MQRRTLVNGLSIAGAFARSGCYTDNLFTKVMGLTLFAWGRKIDHTMRSFGRKLRCASFTPHSLVIISHLTYGTILVPYVYAA